MGPNDLLSDTFGHTFQDVEEKWETYQTKQNTHAFENQVRHGGSFTADIRNRSGQTELSRSYRYWRPK